MCSLATWLQVVRAHAVQCLERNEHGITHGSSAEFAQRVEGVFQAIVGAPDAPGSGEVVDALVALIDMAPEQRPFRTVVSAPIQQLLDSYNANADALRPVVAQIFNVPELAGSRAHQVG